MLRKVILCVFFVILAAGYSQVGKVLYSEVRSVPKILSYQGYLTDTLGIPIDDTLDMTFKIFDAATVGNEWWSETQTSVPIEHGVFSVLLGAVNPIPDSVFTAGTDRWLELTLEGPQTLSPRTRIAAVGYAYTSTYSDTAEYARNAAADNDWVRGTPDSVLFTVNYLGIARGGANNMLYGDSVHTHTNLGVTCTTGTSGQNYYYCTVGGGYNNVASVRYATVGGGGTNYARAQWATVAGGAENTASGGNATVAGGGTNTASGSYATVGGGWRNSAGAQWTTVAGGRENTASVDYASVGGGYDNIASGSYATVSGGYDNTADTTLATVGGGYLNNASGYRATIGGGYSNSVTNDYTTVGGGHSNSASGWYATVAGGQHNTASGWCATVAGGKYSTASGDCAVAAGADNIASAMFATVAGGSDNTASENAATVAGGEYNTASGIHAIVSGGSSNEASGYTATAAGGFADTVAGDYSFAAGRQVRLTSAADHTFAFGRGFTSATPNAVIFHNSVDGIKVGIGTTSPQRALHVSDVLRLEPSSAPSSPSEGDMYMDATTHKLMVYDGTTWQACW